MVYTGRYKDALINITEKLKSTEEFTFSFPLLRFYIKRQSVSIC